MIESLGLLADAGLAFDVVSVLPRHLEHVPVLAERHPSLRLIIDHLSKPPIGSVDHEPWHSLIARAAEHPHVYAKLSGLYPGEDPEGWTTESIKPFVDHAVESFGPGRLMYGGDWPVSITAGGYQRVWQGLQPIFAALGDSDGPGCSPRRRSTSTGSTRSGSPRSADQLHPYPEPVEGHQLVTIGTSAP